MHTRLSRLLLCMTIFSYLALGKGADDFIPLVIWHGMGKHTDSWCYDLIYMTIQRLSRVPGSGFGSVCMVAPPTASLCVVLDVVGIEVTKIHLQWDVFSCSSVLIELLV